MKKTSAILLSLTLAISLSACQNREAPAYQEETEESQMHFESEQDDSSTKMDEMMTDESEQMQEENESGNILIACFTLGRNADYPENVDVSTSASLVAQGEERYGTTEYVAHLIQEHVGGDLHLIQTAQPYSTDFDAVVDQNHEEMDRGTLPELAASDLDISQYDTVFIGYPVWATDAPQAIFSFLSEYDLSGKTIIPFCTHDGYGAGSSYEEIGEAISGEAVVLDGLAMEASDVPEGMNAVVRWLQEIGMETAEGENGQEEETKLTIAMGDVTLDGVIYDTALANEIRDRFPLMVSMVGFGGREFYGGIDFVPENIEGGQLQFENGDITYCDTNNTMAIFYAQTDRPDLSMEVIPIGRVTSDLAVFEKMPDSVEVTFALAE